MEGGAFTDANGFHCVPGTIVLYGNRFDFTAPLRRGILRWVEQDGDATVEFYDTGQQEIVKFANLCAWTISACPQDPKAPRLAMHVDGRPVSPEPPLLGTIREVTFHGRLADWEISALVSIDPFVAEKKYLGCLSYGLSTCGYDVRLGDRVGKHFNSALVDPSQNIIPEHMHMAPTRDPGYVLAPNEFVLATSMEYLKLPEDVEGSVKDKSTLVRLGLAVQNTVLEPGWEGNVTFEIKNEGPHSVVLREGMPIAQIQFERISKPDRPYDGRYQGQIGVTPAKRGPL